MSRLPASWLMQLARRVCNLPLRFGRPERLRIYLSREGLALCLVKRWFRPVIRMKVILPCALPDANDAHNIATPLAVLSEWLQAHPLRYAIEWIIGIDHVRYLLLPWDKRLSSESFCHTLAAALFAQQFAGSDLPFSAYELRFAPLSFGQPRLAALIPSEVVTELITFAPRHRCRSRQITPALSVVLDSLHPEMKNATGMLALVEGQRLLRVAYDNGQVISLSVQPYSYDRKPAIPSGVTHLFPSRDMTLSKSKKLALALTPDDDPRFAYVLCGVF